MTLIPSFRGIGIDVSDLCSPVGLLRRAFITTTSSPEDEDEDEDEDDGERPSVYVSEPPNIGVRSPSAAAFVVTSRRAIAAGLILTAPVYVAAEPRLRIGIADLEHAAGGGVDN